MDEDATTGFVAAVAFLAITAASASALIFLRSSATALSRELSYVLSFSPVMAACAKTSIPVKPEF